MNTTTYKPYVPSPYKVAQKKIVVEERKSPLQEEIEKNIGTFSLTVTVEEDKNTLSIFKHIPGLVAFLCTLKKGNEIISEGRGTAILNRMNKFVERGVRYAYCASLIDAVVRSTKTLDALYLQTTEQKNIPFVIGEIEHASEKQKNYLRELIKVNITEESKRKYFESQIDQLTKDEASEKIKSFMNNY